MKIDIIYFVMCDVDVLFQIINPFSFDAGLLLLFDVMAALFNHSPLQSHRSL